MFSRSARNSARSFSMFMAFSLQYCHPSARYPHFRQHHRLARLPGTIWSLCTLSGTRV
jgi:hypothetical protein